MTAPIYLDHAASTPVDPAVIEAMAACLRDVPANPSALGHAPGREAQALVEAAREPVAALVNASPGDVVWTSGATEANNLALLGAARFHAARGRHVITSLAEHHSVLAAARQLVREGFRVTWLRPGTDGRVDPAEVAAAIRPDTILVSLMLVNNETGVINDVATVGRLCRERNLYFHVDAVQAAGRVPVDRRAMNIDLLVLSAHKIHGPKGVGALVLDRERIRRVEPLCHGGGQERGLRPGTIATHQVVGMAEAFRLARERLAADAAAVTALRDRLWARLSVLPDVTLNGHPEARAPHILNVSVGGVEGESLFHALRGLAVASGSACTSHTGEPSHVLRLLGRSPAQAASSVRFSLARTTTAAEVDRAAEIFAAGVRHLRSFAPAA